MNDTIAAVATAAGEGGIGIVRISGSNAVAVADRIFQLRNKLTVAELTERQAALGEAVVNNEVIDEAILLKFTAPRSYTGEDVVEIQAHGGAVAVKNILQAALSNGARLAEPGEFTKRAFLNGRMDLAQAEAVIDVIRAKTDIALKAANRGLNGKMSAAVRAIRSELLALLAHIAVAVDYPEDEIDTIVNHNVQVQTMAWLAQLETVLARANSGRILRDGLRVAIVGRPNAGKSSLLNALLGTERAIVTAIPGTTRDLIEECVNIRGIPIVLIDTAGLRETTDIVERIGVERATEIANTAELILYIIDGSEQLQSADLARLRNYFGRLIVIINKTDLTEQIDIAKLKSEIADARIIRASMTQTTGLAEIEQAVAETVYANCLEPEQVMVANARQIEILQRAQSSLKRVCEALEAGMPCDILSVDLREAWESLGEISGETIKEDLLDRIFSEFCLGK
ncbi:MAG: tRNA uridine-5-carboxymethylaminomethyl(34) synthesis GTPase MnmE [Negativicutes bacterium]|jgi:tRNA modification GTPase